VWSLTDLRAHRHSRRAREHEWASVVRTIQLSAIRQRVERLHVEPKQLNPEELVRILRERCQRHSRGNLVRRTPEESRAAGRRLRAMLRGESVEMSGE
jgi:hypothetical protein